MVAGSATSVPAGNYRHYRLSITASHTSPGETKPLICSSQKVELKQEQMDFQTGPFQPLLCSSQKWKLELSNQSGFCVTPLSLHLLKEGHSGVATPLWVASVSSVSALSLKATSSANFWEHSFCRIKLPSYRVKIEVNEELQRRTREMVH